jgi:hypothetical protein
MERAGQVLHQIPESAAMVLSVLTALTLRGGPTDTRATFTCLPTAVSLITSLRTLTIMGNKGKLLLSVRDLKTLASLTLLKSLRVGGRVPGKDFMGMGTNREIENFARFMFKVARRFPHLDLPGFLA